jgi:hypothetical protein
MYGDIQVSSAAVGCTINASAIAADKNARKIIIFP